MGEKMGAQSVEQDAVTPNLFLNIRKMLLDEVTDDVMKDIPTIQKLVKKIRSELDIYPLTKRVAFSKVAGADAGSHILPLASRRYAVISALIYVLPEGRRFFLPPISLSETYTSSGTGFKNKVNIRREAKLFETATRFVESHSDTELLLIDGPLVFSNWWKLSGDEFDRRKLQNNLNKLLHLCHERGIKLCGIVKRPSARYLLNHLGLQEDTDFPDSFLLLQALKPGERTDIFSPVMAMKKTIRSNIFMDVVETPIYSFFSRLNKDWSIPPIRVDIPVYSLASLDEIADYCYSTSFWSGIPLPIIKADEEVKIGKQFMADIYHEIISRVGRKTGRFRHIAPYWGEAKWMGA